MLHLNLSQNAYLAPPGGYPFRLSPMQDAVADAFLPRMYSSVTATVKADTVANVHLGLFMPPIISGSDDLGVIAQTDLALSGPKTTITVSVPSTLPTVSQVPAGSIALTSGSATVTGTGTSFATDGSMLGYQLHVECDQDSKHVNLWYTISSIASATSLTLTTNATNTASGIWNLRPPYVNPPGYVVRLWVDGLVNRTTDTISHQPGTAGYSTSQNAGLPQGVTVYSVTVS